MASTTHIWPTKRSNLVMGASVLTIGAMATPAARDWIHETLHIKEEHQAVFDVVVVAGATALGLYGLYQRGRGDAASFILSSPVDGHTQWVMTAGGTPKKPKAMWEISVLDPKEASNLA